MFDDPSGHSVKYTGIDSIELHSSSYTVSTSHNYLFQSAKYLQGKVDEAVLAQITKGCSEFIGPSQFCTVPEEVENAAKNSGVDGHCYNITRNGHYVLYEYRGGFIRSCWLERLFGINKLTYLSTVFEFIEMTVNEWYKYIADLVTTKINNFLTEFNSNDGLGDAIVNSLERFGLEAQFTYSALSRLLNFALEHDLLLPSVVKQFYVAVDGKNGDDIVRLQKLYSERIVTYDYNTGKTTISVSIYKSYL